MKNLLKKLLQSKKEKEKELEQKKSLWAGILFLVIGGGMTIFTGYLLWDRFFIAPDLESILPEKDLVALLSLEEVGDWEVFSAKKSNVSVFVDEWKTTLLGVDPSEIESWRGDKGGAALYAIHDPSADRSASLMTFIEVRKNKLARDYLAGKNPRQISAYRNYEIFEFMTPKEEYCSIILKYLACADHILPLQNLIDSVPSDPKFLADTEDFEKAASELPRRSTAWLFVRIEPLRDLLPEGGEWKFVIPFSKTISAFGGALTEKPGDNSIEWSFLFLRSEPGKELELADETVALRGDLPETLSLLPKGTTAFLWGNDLSEEIENGFRYFAEVDPSFEILLRNEIKTRIESLFDNEISWTDDIVPLLKSEYVAGLDESGWFVVFKTNDEEFAAAKLDKFVRGFSKMSAQYIPKIISYTLSDGTTVSELFPDENAVLVEEKELPDGSAFSLEASDDTGDPLVSMSVGRSRDLLVIGSPKGMVENIMNDSGDPDITQDFPVTFAGSSEEIFSIRPLFFKKWMVGTSVPVFQRISGKFVTTPLFLRIQGVLEL